ncbi:hypothetical protein IGI04_006259 [Brassica rapa subsp. trilocularis]|uniref:Uncharacterized protein n=1 Tax=Brassica rapa subsp. trilocularis TaxID=1813537 RepID=A0ABQ7NGC5_BRACM|nr:hypothetical protein IGI04_006259 [Brassica rapa subsp. trilocularis]
MRFKISIDASMTYHVPDLDPFYSDHRKVTLKLSDGRFLLTKSLRNFNKDCNTTL